MGAKKLYKVHATVGGAREEGVSVFPFFTLDGQVLGHLVVPAEGHNAYYAEADKATVVMPVFGRLRIEPSYAGMRLVNEDVAQLMAPLWHYDPWWVLAEPRFAGRPWVPAVKRTNVVPHLADGIAGMLFSPDLRWLDFVERERGDGYVFERYSAAMVTPPPRSPESALRSTPPKWTVRLGDTWRIPWLERTSD